MSIYCRILIESSLDAAAITAMKHADFWRSPFPVLRLNLIRSTPALHNLGMIFFEGGTEYPLQKKSYLKAATPRLRTV